MKNESSVRIRRAADRGVAEHGWLHSRHTFSFGGYHDPKHMGFHALRVINDDRVESGEGFGTHPHRDMEIISYVIEGALEHKDSMGNGSVIRPGDVQYMSAGAGVTHSEFNPSADQTVHFLQIWIQPQQKGCEPRYGHINVTRDEKTNTLKLVASPDGADGAIAIRQDARIYATLLEPDAEVSASFSSDRHVWVQVVDGILTLNGETLEAGDGVAIEYGMQLDFKGLKPSEILVFDLG